MINRTEMHKFADLLDKEFKDVIVPLLTESHKNLRPVFDYVLNKDYVDMCKRNYFYTYRYGQMPSDIWDIVRRLEIGEGNGEIYFKSIPNSIISFLGYAPVAYPEETFWSILNNDRYRRNDALAVNFITETKQWFETIKNCYNTLFVKDNGAMFKRLVDSVMEVYNNTMSADRKKDNELYALFGMNKTEKKLKVTITIEEI